MSERRIENIPVRLNGHLAGVASIDSDGTIILTPAAENSWHARNLMFFADRNLIESFEIGFNAKPAYSADYVKPPE